MPELVDSLRGVSGRALEVVYRSTSGLDGSPTTVSGAVFTPLGTPPAAGWPVVAFAHGTSGILVECAPSDTPDLARGAGFVESFLNRGYAVTATDYEGLGTDGIHPYLDAKTAGLNVIDSVRALRHVADDVSATWGAVGGSQGGAATWAANEQAASYAPELDLVGTVSLVPLADMSGLIAHAEDGTLTPDQVALYIWGLNRLVLVRPELDLDDYRRGSVTANWDDLEACDPAEQFRRDSALAEVTPDELRPSTPEAADRIRAVLEEWALPQVRAIAPMMVFYGGRDTFVLPDWTRAALGRACAAGSKITSIYQPDRGHGDIDGQPYFSWLDDRFARLTAPDTCGQPVR